MRGSNRRSSTNKGFSLVELMIAMVIGLVVLGAVTAVLVNSSKHYHSTDSLSRLQENARFAMGFLQTDLRRAGSLGCAGSTAEIGNMLNTGPGSLGQVAGSSSTIVFSPIEGIENQSATSWAPSSEAVTFSSAVANTDALVVRYFDQSSSITLQQDMLYESDALLLSTGHGLKLNDIVSVTDCDTIHIFQITSITAGSGTCACLDAIGHAASASPAPGNANGDFKSPPKAYQKGSFIYKAAAAAYYIGAGASGQPSLRRITISSGDQELVEGIDNLQVLYGISNSTDPKVMFPLTYLSANLITPNTLWLNVRSVRIGLLASTMANTRDGQYGTETDTATYDINGTSWTALGDRRLRKVFTSTINLRNASK